MNTSKELQNLFDDLQMNAYNSDYHTYYYKDANQITRKHFERFEKQVKVKPEVKPANGVTIKEDKESNSIILEGNGLRYECYFDKKYHSIFVGEPQAGSLISIGTPESPTGTLKVEFYPLF